MENNYVPSEEILNKYADVMVNFALNGGKGIRKGEVAFITVPEIAKPMLKPLYRTILKAGGHPIIQYIPDDMETEIYTYGSDEQISYFPGKLLKGRVDEVNHLLFVIADKNPKALKDINPEKIMMNRKPFKQYRDWRAEKENKGEMSWTLCLYATPAVADEAGMPIKEYWDEIIKACYLDEENPVAKWQYIQKESDRIINELNNLHIEKINIKAENIDLNLTLGKNRQWLGGRGCNIPSFEIFTSPDWRGTEGYIKFNKPLYSYGNLIKGIELEFTNGVISKFAAEENLGLLKELLKVENADKIGEFSLTDSRMSRITKFMAETLFDENVGGEYGNTHIAIGASYDETYNGDLTKMNDKLREELGLNNSAIHSDIISTENRVVTATLKDGTKKIIYQDGQFQI
jgi:aminopeptidase